MKMLSGNSEVLNIIVERTINELKADESAAIIERFREKEDK